LTLVTLGALAAPASAATIYLCRNHGGGEFWSDAHCGRHNALIVRMTSVPDGLPFEQQVNLASQAQRAGERLAATPAPGPLTGINPAGTTTTTTTTTTVTRSTATATPQGECPWIDARIRELDGIARQPQSGATQDAIRAERARLRDRQFALRCR
jgi:hypothetical protein